MSHAWDELAHPTSTIGMLPQHHPDRPGKLRQAVIRAFCTTLGSLVSVASWISAQPLPPQPYKSGGPLELRGPNKKPVLVRVAASRFISRAEPNLKAAAYPQPAYFQEFLAEAYLAGDDKATGFSFLATSDDKKTIKALLGWVPTDLLVFGDEAHKLPNSDLYEKAVIVNTEDSIHEDRTFLTLPKECEVDFNSRNMSDRIRKKFQDKKSLGLSNKARIEVSEFDPKTWLIVDEAPDHFYQFEVRANVAGELDVVDSYEMAAVDDNPFQNAAKDGLPPPTRRSGLRLANTYYVYGSYPATCPSHYLLGVGPNIKATEDPDNVIKGWVRANRVRLWNTRMGLRWTDMPQQQQREPGKVLASPEGAGNWLKGKPAKEIASEPPNFHWKPSDKRMLLTGRAEPATPLHQILFEVAAPCVTRVPPKNEPVSVHSIGYVWHHARGAAVGTAQVKRELFLSEYDLRLLIDTIKAYIDAPRDTLENADILREYYPKIIKDYFEKTPPFQSLKEAFYARFGYTSQAKLLDIRAGMISKGIWSGDQEAVELKKKLERLIDIIEGYDRPSFIKTDKTGLNYQLDIPPREDKYRRKEDNYFIQPGSPMKYYWVPIEELP